MESLLEEYPSAQHLISLGLSFSFAAYLDAMRSNDGDVVAAADWLMSMAANGHAGGGGGDGGSASDNDGMSPPVLRGETSDDEEGGGGGFGGQVRLRWAVVVVGRRTCTAVCGAVDCLGSHGSATACNHVMTHSVALFVCVCASCPLCVCFISSWCAALRW